MTLLMHTEFGPKPSNISAFASKLMQHQAPELLKDALEDFQGQLRSPYLHQMKTVAKLSGVAHIQCRKMILLVF